MAIASSILIGAYLLWILLVIKWPTRQHNPEDGMAVGCLMLVAMGLLAIGLMLAVGVVFHLRPIVYGVFVITAFPAALALPQLAWEGIKKLKANATARGVKIPADKLAGRLSGVTHIVRRADAELTRVWNELRYYAPDGRIICYEEVGSEVKRVPSELTWSVDHGRLTTLGDICPGNRSTYVLRDTPDGQIAYYIHLPLSKLNRRLSRKTIAVHEGAPVETAATNSSDKSSATAGDDN
jgi:hypothetical protein